MLLLKSKRMANALFIKLFLYTSTVLCVEGVVASNIPNSANGLTRNELIKIYFMEGLKYMEIVLFLFCHHNIIISVRHLKRILLSLNFQRRPTHFSSVRDTINIVKQEMKVSGGCIGYRTMWKRLTKDHGLSVKRTEIMQIMKHLSPHATEKRKAHRLQRRMYTVKGPNYLWHVDGYEKLKPFGFCIHGCIDGYSRRIMRLEVESSNTNPAIVTHYYLDCLKHLKLASQMLRADNGTKNNRMSFLLFRYFLTGSMAGIKSFISRKSTANKRIDARWICKL